MKTIDIKMACSCDDEDKEICKSMVETVLDEKWESIDKEYLTTCLFYELQKENANLCSHGHDMWSGISVEVNRKGEEKFLVYVTCDIIEFGIAKILMYLKGKLPSEEVSLK